MSAANRRELALDRPELVSVIVGGVPQDMPYRRAVGLISLGRAEWAKPEKPKRAKKASVSPAARKGQDGAEAGNKPPTGDTPHGGA